MAVTAAVRRAARWTAGTLAVLALAVAVGAVWVRGRVAASLPVTEGTVAVAGLASPVSIGRDARGVPRIQAASRTDAALALGFLHAQERFFQLDLLRRRAAGELAELLGAPAVAADREARRHRLRAVAEASLARAGEGERRVIAAYAAGVNGGLAALAAPPFEYQLLRVGPARWQAADTVLVALAMYLTLQDAEGEGELTRGTMRDTLPPALLAFLLPAGTEWDAPLSGGPLAAPPPPGPEALDLRRPGGVPVAGLGLPEGPRRWVGGSNNWALAGWRSGSGAALVANDPHLPLGVPATWYPACLEWRDDAGAHRVVGATLPGTPAVVIGSNGRVAWGFTNSQADTSDVVLLELEPADPEVYRTAAGPRRLEHFAERIRVHGGADVALDVPWTVWGPVLGTDRRGRPYALRWVAHDPAAVGLGLLGLETATTVEEAIAAAHHAGIPAQNLVCGSADGHIAWTIAGRLPRRVGCDGRLPTSDADGGCRWDGWLEDDELPSVVDPPGGALWTANARVVGGPALAALGDGNYELGARARQVRDDLAALAARPAAERDMLAIQLDDRAVFLARWRDHLLALLDGAALAGRPQRAEFRRLLETSWGGRAGVGSVGYRLLREFRLELARRAFAALVAPCRAADPGFDLFAATAQWEGPLWALVTARPAHLVDPGFPSWPALELSALDAVIAALTRDGRRLASGTWGERNTARIRHPLSGALPWIGGLLDLPAEPLPGDRDMPRVQSPRFGASLRLCVAPGHEERGILELPGGESGNPLSPHYRDQFAAWADGEATPLLPGPPVSSLALVPRR